MAESFAEDTATLRAMARGAGLTGIEEMSHDELVTALREAGLAEPTGEPIDTSLADPGDPGTDEGVYHGAGVGRRETLGGAGAQTAGIPEDSRSQASSS
ncbi:MAG TPA: hypothetical protein VFX60_15075 [Micromonospora sp.]|nr:hypothetical protein [Micromonospora sp.]